MAFDIGASVGDLSSWMGGVTMPQPTPSTKVTDLSPQADGGRRAQGKPSPLFGSKGGHPAYDAVILLLAIAALLAAFHYSVRAHIL